MADGGATGKAAQRYAALYNGREPFLIRARQAATLTKPYLMPPLGFNYTMQLPTPFQSLGARGVRNLASKLLLALFPANQTFFKYEIDDFLLEQIEDTAKAKGGDPNAARGDFEEAMSRRERAIMVEMDKALFRPPAFVALELLVATGNALLHVPLKGPIRCFRLDQYVVRRDPEGNVLEIIVEEDVNPATLPEPARSIVLAKEGPTAATGEYPDSDKDQHRGTGEKSEKLYTRIFRTTTDQWVVYQECRGIILPGSSGHYPADQCPWLPLRMSSQPCEDYGRSYVEEFLGDLDSLEALSETLVEGTAAVARVLWLVAPNSVTRPKVISGARNGDVQIGKKEDVSVVSAENKSADFQTAFKQAQQLQERLSYAFMLNSSIQRSGERVTAEEIRYMAGELDDALGGVYTLLAAEFQLPIVMAFERRMQKERNVPPLPKGVAEPSITTGLEAIGRGNDLQNMKAFVGDVLQIVGQQGASSYLNFGEFLKRSCAAYGIDPTGLVYSDAQRQQMQAQQAQQEQVNNLAPHAIKAVGGVVQSAIAAHAQNQGQSGADQQQGSP